MATKQQQVKRPAKRAAGRTGSGRAARSRSGGAPAAQEQQRQHERRGTADSWLTVRLPRELRDQANARAAAQGRDLSFIVRELLSDYAAGGLDVVIKVQRRD